MWHPVTCTDGNARLTTCLFKYEVWPVHFSHTRSNDEVIRIKHFSSQKNDGIFHIFIRLMEPRWKSRIAIFSWRVAWNYAYSPFTKFNYVLQTRSIEIHCFNIVLYSIVGKLFQIWFVVSTNNAENGNLNGFENFVELKYNLIFWGQCEIFIL